MFNEVNLRDWCPQSMTIAGQCQVTLHGDKQSLSLSIATLLQCNDIHRFSTAYVLPARR